MCQEAVDKNEKGEVVFSQIQRLSGMEIDEAENYVTDQSAKATIPSALVPSSIIILLPWHFESHYYEAKSEPDEGIFPLSSIHPVEALDYRPSKSNFSQASSSQQATEQHVIHVCDPVAREGIDKANAKLDVIQDLLLKLLKK